MLYKVGTKKELSMLEKKLPYYVSEKLSEYIDILNDAYGENRDYTKRGGYVLLSDDYSIVLCMPVSIAPDIILNELRGDF